MRRIAMLLPLLLIVLVACSPQAATPPADAAAVDASELPEVIAYRSPT
jgi:hypothetical protein